MAAVIAAVLATVVVAGCAADRFDPTAPCTGDDRLPGAYPSLEALVPRSLDGAPPTRVDSGRSCSPGGLGTLAGHGIKEMHFAGSTWDKGSNSGTTIAVLEAPDLSAAWVHEFYAKGAEAGRKTESVESSETTVAGQPAFRVDTLNGESYQTVIDWQDGDQVRVVLVASFIRLVSSKAEHEAAVQAALEAATAEPAQ
jgi:hypothetical protein